MVFDIGQVVSSVNGLREAANLLDLDQTHCVIPPPALIGSTLELTNHGWRQHVDCRKALSGRSLQSLTARIVDIVFSLTKVPHICF